MEKRRLGRTGLHVSVLTFGCGAVGGLMTKGEPRDQERAVARALEAGVNLFDTAAAYGNGASETNLGRVLASLKPANIIVSTKVRLPAERQNISAAIATSMDASLKRLGRDHVDLFQLHNEIGAQADGGTMSVEEALDAAAAFEKLRQQGKTRFIGFTAIGETAALHRLIDSRAYETAQVPYNALNPSAGSALPARYPAQDYGRMLERMVAVDMGSIGIRVLAAGALSGREERHPLGSQDVAPIGSGGSYKADVERARRLEPMVAEGHAASLTEMAMRFAIANRALTTTEIGLSNIEQLDAAIAAITKGPLSAAAMNRLGELQAGFGGEVR